MLGGCKVTRRDAHVYERDFDYADDCRNVFYDYVMIQKLTYIVHHSGCDEYSHAVKSGGQVVIGILKVETIENFYLNEFLVSFE